MSTATQRYSIRTCVSARTLTKVYGREHTETANQQQVTNRRRKRRLSVPRLHTHNVLAASDLDGLIALTGQYTIISEGCMRSGHLRHRCHGHKSLLPVRMPRWCPNDWSVEVLLTNSPTICIGRHGMASQPSSQVTYPRYPSQLFPAVAMRLVDDQGGHLGSESPSLPFSSAMA